MLDAAGPNHGAIHRVSFPFLPAASRKILPQISGSFRSFIRSGPLRPVDRRGRVLHSQLDLGGAADLDRDPGRRLRTGCTWST